MRYMDSLSYCLRVTSLLVAPALFLVSCQREPKRCLDLERELLTNPREQAKYAISKGDHRLLGVGGFVPIVPGIDDGRRPLKILPNTSDSENMVCRSLRDDAKEYAKIYNQYVVFNDKLQ